MIQCLAPTAVPLVPNAVHLAQHHKTRETQDSTYAAEPANSIDSHRAAADPYDTIKSVFCSDASKKAALDTATQAMTLYARPTVSDKEWIQELGQLMTSQAVADYQYVDPANIPVKKIIGTGQLKVDENNGFGCHVVFTTDAGSYDVQLLRAAADKPWQVNRFTPPNGTK